MINGTLSPFPQHGTIPGSDSFGAFFSNTILLFNSEIFSSLTPVTEFTLPFTLTFFSELGIAAEELIGSEGGAKGEAKGGGGATEANEVKEERGLKG
ncbi:hypothetical protein WN943_011604 [Citrus x changshan-huyou]